MAGSSADEREREEGNALIQQTLIGARGLDELYKAKQVYGIETVFKERGYDGRHLAAQSKNSNDS